MWIVFWKKTKSPFIVKDIKNKIKHDLNIWIDNEEIRELMKTKLNLSFKRDSSSPTRVDPLKDKTIMITHWIRLVN